MLVLWGKIQGLCREECGNLLFHVEQMGAFFAPKRALIDEHQGQSSSGSQKRVTLLPGGLSSISSGRPAKFEDFPTSKCSTWNNTLSPSFILGRRITGYARLILVMETKQENDADDNSREENLTDVIVEDHLVGARCGTDRSMFLTGGFAGPSRFDGC
jgi:hypothetical protein